MHDDFDSLCASYLDGTLDERSRDELAALLESDPAKVAVLRSQLLLSGSLARLRPDLDDEHFLRTVMPHVHAMSGEAEEAFPSRVRKSIRTARWRRGALAAAAVMALAATLFVFHGRRGDMIASRFDGESPSQPVRVGDKLEFSQGVSRLEFSNGAVVAVEAPAAMSFRSPEEVVLDYGRLNAWCPETAHGFRVITRSATLTDLGTSFGVSAARDGTADFVVLDGKVEVQKDGETRTVERGAALRANHGRGLSKIAFEPSAFKRTWPVASGIHSTRGAVVPAPPGTREALAAYESDRHILVIPERRDFHPGKKIPVNILEPGGYEGRNLFQPVTFSPPPKTKVRSYLLRYNPVGKLEKKDHKLIEGSVTFDRPVLAIIAGSRLLHLSDEVFSSAPLPKMTEVDSKLRGLESSPNLIRSDRVELSKDRRMLKVTFIAGESIDELRAITADD